MHTQEILSALKHGIGLTERKGKVIIIGAGMAGITAAHILKKTGIEVTLLEANDYYGGRVWSKAGLYHYPVELGAEEVHGDQHVWYELIQAQGIPLEAYEEEYDEYYWVDGKLIGYEEVKQDPGFRRALNFWETLEKYEGDAEMNLATLIRESQVPQKWHFLLEAWYSAEYGTSTHNINVSSLQEIAEKWQAGDTNYILTQGSCSAVIEATFGETLREIQLNWPVKEVDYQKDKILLKNDHGDTLHADKVLLTVPLGVLKAGQICFTPELPANKQSAIQNLGVDTGIKLIMRFREPFWPEYTGNILSPGLIPDFYISAKDDTPILTAYVMGDRARQLSEMGENLALQMALQELDQMYGAGKASQNLRDYLWADWGRMPYFQGAYSYPTPHSEIDRITLAKPIDQKLYFAGEATNYHGHPATVQGAIESAYRAVREILLDKPKQKGHWASSA